MKKIWERTKKNNWKKILKVFSTKLTLTTNFLGTCSARIFIKKWFVVLCKRAKG